MALKNTHDNIFFCFLGARVDFDSFQTKMFEPCLLAKRYDITNYELSTEIKQNNRYFVK